MHLKSENRLFSCVEQVLEELAALCRGKPAPREDGQGYLMIQRAFILPVDREDLCALYSQLRQCAALARALGGRLPPLAQPLLDWQGPPCRRWSAPAKTAGAATSSPTCRRWSGT